MHIPVLLHEVLEYFNPKPNQNFIDCTFGGGGHGLEILKIILPNGKLLAIDANGEIKKLRNKEIKGNKNLIFVNDNFRNLDKIVKNYFSYPVNGILLDLGLSSDELENSGRGFSFLKDEPLDMRFDIRQNLTAFEIINYYAIENLKNILKNFGDYRYDKNLEKKIIELRKKKKIKTTFELVEVVRLVARQNFKEKIHPATKVFQALRIAVNDELRNLSLVLPQTIDILAPLGRLIVISFHALEDRIVKNFFRDTAKAEAPFIKILTKKPIVSTTEEIKNNPRSRSAKMRIIEKLENSH